jgi:hypothetical protein
MNFLYFVILFAVGIVAILYAKWITDTTGRVDWAEKYLGSYGTYNLWKILGVLAIVMGFYILFGGFNL